MLLGLALRSLPRGQRPNAPVPQPVPETKAGAFAGKAIAALMAGPTIANFAAMGGGSVSFSLINWWVIQFLVLLAVAMVLVPIANRRRGFRPTGGIRKLPGPVNTDHTPAQYRERAAQLAPPAPPMTIPAPARPATISVKELRLGQVEDARLQRVASILLVSCPYCAASEIEFCKPVAGETWYALDKGRGIYAHSLRIIKAVSSGTARLDDVTAQFDGNVPESLWGALL